MNRFIPCFLLLITASPIIAYDLTKIDRKIAKEPAYQSKPRYCLLVFGSEANHKVWLVHDGTHLYVDRNGNSDLTEPAEKVSCTMKEGYSDPSDHVYSFEVSDIQVGSLLHKNLTVSFTKLDNAAEHDPELKKLLTKQPSLRGVRINIELESKGHKGVGVGGRLKCMGWHRDSRGLLTFADKPGDAPIIHLGGMWSITQFDRNTLQPGRQVDFVLGFGFIGLGPGTTIYVGYEELVPEGVYPQLAVTYPVKNPGDPPVKEIYELKERC